MKIVVLLTLFGFILLGGRPCTAASPEPGESGGGGRTPGGTAWAPQMARQVGPSSLDVEPELRFPGVASLNAFHGYFSQNVETLSHSIDSFFGTRRAYEESSGTYVQLRGSLIHSRLEGSRFDGKLRARLDLPNLKHRFNLLFESVSDEDQEENPLITGVPYPQGVADKRLAASLQYVMASRERLDVRLQPGIKVKWPPDPFLRLRVRWLKPLSRIWLSRTTVIPAWYSSRGLEGRARLDLERSPGDGDLFRASTEGIWQMHDRRNLFLTQSFFFAHPLSPQAQVAYEAGVSGEIDPDLRDTGYYANFRYRRNIHQGWLFLEVKPQLAFERGRGFRPDPSLTLTMDMLFGARYR